MLSIIKSIVLISGLCLYTNMPLAKGQKVSENGEPIGEFCGIKNTSFQEKEVITMKVFYNALGVYIGAGEASFTTSLERFNGKTVYH